jgi:hypothetical protein
MPSEALTYKTSSYPSTPPTHHAISSSFLPLVWTFLSSHQVKTSVYGPCSPKYFIHHYCYKCSHYHAFITFIIITAHSVKQHNLTTKHPFASHVQAELPSTFVTSSICRPRPLLFVRCAPLIGMISSSPELGLPWLKCVPLLSLARHCGTSFLLQCIPPY